MHRLKLLDFTVITKFVLSTLGAGSDAADWLSNLIPADYNRYKPPEAIEKIYFAIWPSTITEISIKSMDFEIESEFMVYWLDSRMKVDETIFNQSKGMPAELSPEFIKKLWRPRLLFSNCKKCNPFLVSPDRQFYLRLYPTSPLLMTIYRETILFICLFDLQSYPFDVQNCNPGHSSASLTFINLPLGAIDVPPEYQLMTQFKNNCTKITNETQKSLHQQSRNRKQCYEYVFRLRRNISSFLILIYIPSSLIIIISWLSFWLDPTTAGPRVALGLTSILTLATQFNAAQRELPPVAYVKALDIWMFFCVFIVFASLVVFAASNYRKRKETTKTIEILNSDTKYFEPNRGIETCNKQITYLKRLLNKMARKATNFKSIDHFARIIFPLSFLLFNFIYWPYYLNSYYAN